MTDSELPPPPEKFGPDGERGWEKLLERMREGKWRRTTLARSLGVVPEAINRKMERSPEWAARFLQAQAEGEMAIVAKFLDAAANGKDWKPYLVMLERLHGWASPEARARLAQARADRRKEIADPIEPDERFL